MRTMASCLLTRGNSGALYPLLSCSESQPAVEKLTLLIWLTTNTVEINILNGESNCISEFPNFSTAELGNYTQYMKTYITIIL